ncbi:thrombopoietin [Sarotherodon galilaeus]
MDSQQPLTEGLRRSGRDSRPPAHLQQYDVQQSQTECQHSDKDTHGLQDPVGESESQPETRPAPLPTNQDEVMRELLTTMREIRQFMFQSSPSHSRSSRSSIHTVSSDGIKSSVCSLRASPQTHQQHEQFPVIDTATCQSPFQPPQISRQSGLVPAASPPLPNSTILDAAVPSSGLPRPVLATPDETPFNFLATPLQGPHQISCVQPAIPLDEDPAQPLICIPEPRQHPPVKQQPATSNGLHEEKPLVPITASSSHPVSTRTHVYKLEGPSFPDLTSEDEIQYRLLRMALTNLLDPHETEHFNYHVLLDHLKVDQAKRLALAFSYAPDPYTQAIKALDERYGQPRQLALKELRNILELPPIRAGDGWTLDNFALRVQALVGLLSTMGDQGRAELDCGSHVDRLLAKLPAEHFSRFKRHVYREQAEMTYTLPLFSSWLQMECKCQPRKASPVSSFKQPRPALQVQENRSSTSSCPPMALNSFSHLLLYHQQYLRPHLQCHYHQFHHLWLTFRQWSGRHLLPDHLVLPLPSPVNYPQHLQNCLTVCRSGPAAASHKVGIWTCFAATAGYMVGPLNCLACIVDL